MPFNAILKAISRFPSLVVNKQNLAFSIFFGTFWSILAKYWLKLVKIEYIGGGNIIFSYFLSYSIKKKVWKISKLGGRGSWPIPNFFLDFLGFFPKAMGKHWKWPNSSRNAKKSFFQTKFRWCTVQFCTVRYCTVQGTTPPQKWNFFLIYFYLFSVAIAT